MKLIGSIVVVVACSVTVVAFSVWGLKKKCKRINLDPINVSYCGSLNFDFINGTKDDGVTWSVKQVEDARIFLKNSLNRTFDENYVIVYYFVPDLKLVYRHNLSDAYLNEHPISIADLKTVYKIIE